MKPFHWILLLILVAGSALLITRKDDTADRVDERIDLNWKFMQGDDPAYSTVQYDDSEWKFVSLPHDWMITREVSRDNPSGTAGGFYPGGVAWYRKDLYIGAYDEKEKFYLVFEGVYMNADVWVNGNNLGEHKYGYIGFHFDITPFVRKDTINVVAVRTDCSSMPADRWYSGAGIYRHVRLVATENLHFPVHNTRITTEVRDGNRYVIAETDVMNSENRSRRYSIRSDLVTPSGNLVSSTITTANAKENSRSTVRAEHLVSDPQLWSDKDPAQYELNTYLVNRKTVTDQVATKFGIRDIAFSPDSGFILNGKKVWLKGVCLHHDGGALGAAVPDATWEYRLKKLKLLGVNALRLSHNPHSSGLLDLCDRMGFLVIGEMYDKWEQQRDKPASPFDFKNTWKEDLAYFIRRDFNHPSVIAWSMGNETIEQLEAPEAGVEWYKTLAALTRSVDSSRMITCGLHPASPKRGHELPSGYIHVEPLVSYNYRTDSFASWHEQYPDLIWLASETKAYSERRMPDYGEISYLDNSWMKMDTFVVGQFIWAGIDYFGESASWPNRSFYNGLLKTNGEVKPYAYYTQSIYSETPMVKIAVVDRELVDSLNNSTSWQIPWAGAPVVRHWNFNEQGRDLQVVVYSNCPEVELTLNDSLLDLFARKNFEDGVIKTRVAFKPGAITARATYRDADGSVLYVMDSLVTAGPPYMILMEPDRTEMIADGQDVVHIETRVTDEDGITSPSASNTISYQLSGPGKIRVIDNGDPNDHTSHRATAKGVRNGRHLLIIQSAMEPGDLIIRAKSDGLKSAEVTVSSVSPEQE
ncbi:MAG: glycoside hydrolase family 2 TIM barrel-domain containing protein [Bacteroidales bacterium]|nr:glycoside hydrolase family 2 TIM barrel-domain containing protein [Bacteroidales bacterium]